MMALFIAVGISNRELKAPHGGNVPGVHGRHLK